MDTSPPAPRDTRANPWWPVAALVVALAVLFIAAGLWVFHSLRKLPGELAAGGQGMVQELREVARAFHTGTVHHIFLSHATSIEGTAYLQVATLRQTEIYQLEDRASTLWGALELPAVAVRATAPVEYTYHVDLHGTWHFELHNNRVLVLAPPLRFNKPAIDASRIEYEVRQGSRLRDERAVLERLKRELTGRSVVQASKNIDLVRETARRQVQRYVETWLAHSFDDGELYAVEVFFVDEAEEFEARMRPLPRPGPL
jgi:orotidine-5'-phosphate decarboxylase